MLPLGYQLRAGSSLERSQLLKFAYLTYQELLPGENLSHLPALVDSYLSPETRLWWVELEPIDAASPIPNSPVGCLWLGNAIDQVRGDRYAHIFLLYVVPECRRQGIGTVLMQYAENWAKIRGDRQIGLQVFQFNQPAINLYRNLGYETHSLWMAKSLKQD